MHWLSPAHPLYNEPRSGQNLQNTTCPLFGGSTVHTCTLILIVLIKPVCLLPLDETIPREDIQVRLVDGNVTEGRVEVSNDNGVTWGTVCDDSWDLNAANVVCRQLGFDRATEAISNGYFGYGSGDISMDDVTCFGSESNIGQCHYSGWNVHNCVHHEDAGVRCYCELCVCTYVCDLCYHC